MIDLSKMLSKPRNDPLVVNSSHISNSAANNTTLAANSKKPSSGRKLRRVSINILPEMELFLSRPKFKNISESKVLTEIMKRGIYQISKQDVEKAKIKEKIDKLFEREKKPS